MKRSTLTAESAFSSEKVPTYRTRSCREPGGHLGLFRAGCGGENRTLRISLLVPPRPPRGVSSPTERVRGHQAPARPGLSPSLVGKGPPGPGRGNLDNEFVPLRNPDAEGAEAGLAASTPGSSVGAQLVKILVRTGCSGPG